ncbi:MAG: DUF2244 domain-containing protein [Pseudomonadota bacterium]
MTPSDTTDRARRYYFDAVLTPNRSLPRRGFWLLMAVLVITLGGVGLAFSTLGAWPVAGFCGLEVLLVWGAFHLNYRSGRMVESVRLDEKTLTVTRSVPHRPLKSWQFQPHWVRVNMDDPPEHDSKLQLSSHGRTVTIGSFLTADERLEVAQALRRAIEDWRDPSTKSWQTAT